MELYLSSVLHYNLRSHNLIENEACQSHNIDVNHKKVGKKLTLLRDNPLH